MKPFAMGPNLARIMGDEDRNVADQAHAPLVGVVTQRGPLLEQEILDQMLGLELAHVGVRPVRKRASITLGELGAPLGPGPIAVVNLECMIERIVIQPIGVRMAEFGIVLAVGFVRALLEAMNRTRDQRPFPGDQCIEIDQILIELRVIEMLGVDPASLQQELGTDQQWVERECRGALIRRFTIACRAERKHLPQTLSRRHEKIDETIGRWTQIADPERAGQRGGMKENATGPMHAMTPRMGEDASRAVYRKRQRKTVLDRKKPPERSPEGSAPADREVSVHLTLRIH